MTAQQLLEKMADLESRIAVIYERFVTQFRTALYASDLWGSMSHEELHHADLLSRAIGSVGSVPVDAATEDRVRKLDAVVLSYEGEQAHIVNLQDALAATADLEEAEADYLHSVLGTLGEAGRSLAANPALQHKTRRVLDHAIELHGTAALRQRLAWHRFKE